MKNFKHTFSAILTAAVLAALSCASSGDAGIKMTAEISQALLPIKAGWYRYDFERTFKGIEEEYNFFMNSGMKMVQEHTRKYSGVVCRFEDGVLYDPVTGIELLIDDDGRISCAENISIKGALKNNGRFFWSGLEEEQKRLNLIFVKGTLTPLPSSARGGPGFDGIYRMADTGTGREILARIDDGFYTWHFVDGKDAGFTPWPTPIRPDGSFSFGMDQITVMEMGEFSSANFSTGFSMKGVVIPGQGISVEEISRSTGMGLDQGDVPQIYAGAAIRWGQYPNEAIPDSVEKLVRTGRAAIKAEPKPNPEKYPSWYLRPPVKPGFIYAVGETTFDVQDLAFSIAEAAAAANIAEIFWVGIESSTIDKPSGAGTVTKENIKNETLQRMNYRIIERFYNDETRTAFVLAEASLD